MCTCPGTHWPGTLGGTRTGSDVDVLSNRALLESAIPRRYQLISTAFVGEGVSIFFDVAIDGPSGVLRNTDLAFGVVAVLQSRVRLLSVDGREVPRSGIVVIEEAEELCVVGVGEGFVFGFQTLAFRAVADDAQGGVVVGGDGVEGLEEDVDVLVLD